MAQINNTTFKTNVTNINSLQVSDGKIDAAELQQLLNNLADSAGWEDTKYTMPSNTFDCNNGRLQERTLSGNGTLAISNAISGKYYTLIKKGDYTLTMPTGEFAASGSITGTGTTIVTFMYDGTDYYFNFSTYSAT